jgi:uncharacterized protein (UPF0332 family)
MTPKAFLWLAAKLLKDTTNETGEASLRTCVSRSYYALFNLMAQFVGESFPKVLSRSAGDHEKVYRYLYNCGVATVKSAASSLNELRDQRNDADYKLDLNQFDGNCVTLAYKKAGIAIDSFEKTIQSAEGRQAVIRGVESYRKVTKY